MLNGITTNLILSILVKGGGAIMALTLSAVISRMLCIDEAAVVFWVFSLMNILVVTSMCGADLLVVRDVTRYMAAGDLLAAVEVRNSALNLVILTSIFVIGLFYITNLVIKYPVNMDNLVYWVLLGVGSICYMTITGEALRGLGQYFILNLFYGIFVPGICVIGVIISTYHFDLNAKFVISFYSLAIFVSAIIIGSVWNYKLSGLEKVKKLSVSVSKSVFINSFPYYLFTGINSVITFVPIIILGFLSEKVDMGVYYAAMRISVFLTFFLSASNIVFAPKMAAAHANNDYNELSNYFNISSLFGLLTALPCMIAIVFESENIMLLFGEDYKDGADLLRILAAGQLVSAMTGNVNMLLMMTSHKNTVAIINIIALLLCILGNYLMIGELGSTGAAITSSITVAFVNITALLFCFIYIGIIPNYLSTLKNIQFFKSEY